MTSNVQVAGQSMPTSNAISRGRSHQGISSVTAVIAHIGQRIERMAHLRRFAIGLNPTIQNDDAVIGIESINPAVTAYEQAVPALASCRISCSSCSREGAIAAQGSSSSSTREGCISSLASRLRCCWPPDKASRHLASRGIRPTRCRTASISQQAEGIPGGCPRITISRMVMGNDQSMRPRCGIRATRARQDRIGCWPATSHWPAA